MTRVLLRSLLLAGLLATAMRPAEAQLSDPCSLECGLVLGATSFVFASGVATAVGRSSGGFTTTSSGIVAWTSGFVVALGGGIALAGNGERQERAIYSAGIGAVAGSLVGLAADSFSGDSSRATKVAATLVGAAAGALTFGIYGAATWNDDETSAPVPLASFSVPVGF
jgi:hypothetical protein